jgi:hypothetical protein
MCDDKKDLNEKLTEKHLELEEDKDNSEECLKIWTEAITELSEIEDAFKTNEEIELQGKTILDVGTDAVKPLYLALKYEPSKIIGIDESGFREFNFEIESRSKLLTDTKIKLYDGSLFDDIALDKIRKKEEIVGLFDFVLVSKTLHHLRTDKCIEKHKCQEDEESCKYGFNTERVFEKLLSLGKRVVVYEPIDDGDDADKIRGRGCNLTKKEWHQIFQYFLRNSKLRIKFVRPQIFDFSKATLARTEQILREVDLICFYVEKLNEVH